jgi:hypothetical protein
MKQSNIILGIGILVAFIIIVGSFFLKAGPIEHQSATSPIKPISTISQSAKSMAIVPLRVLSKHIIKIN